MMTKIISLAIHAFNNAKKVTNGGLFMIHGLVATVEGRISPHAHGIVNPYLLSATRMETADD